MSEKSEESSKIFMAVITGIISLIVGICSALAINSLTEKRLSLSYDVTTIETFKGPTKGVGIIALQVSNTGQKEVNELECRIALGDAKIIELRGTGISPSALSVKNTESDAQASLPYLNPGETFAIQLLVEPKEEKLQSPTMDIRGKGVVGVPIGKAKKEQTTIEKYSFIITPFMTLFAAAVSMTFLKRFRNYSVPSEKADEIAYLLGLNGFVTEAQLLRESTKDFSYWSLADWFTEKIIADEARNSDIVKRAIVVLEQILTYTERIASSSKAIICMNIARLAQADGDSKRATKAIEDAWTSDRNMVKRRLPLDSQLSQLPVPVSIESGVARIKNG